MRGRATFWNAPLPHASVYAFAYKYEKYFNFLIQYLSRKTFGTQITPTAFRLIKIYKKIYANPSDLRHLRAFETIYSYRIRPKL
jgi:hypothetical protein